MGCENYRRTLLCHHYLWHNCYTYQSVDCPTDSHQTYPAWQAARHCRMVYAETVLHYPCLHSGNLCLDTWISASHVPAELHYHGVKPACGVCMATQCDSYLAAYPR